MPTTEELSILIKDIGPKDLSPMDWNLWVENFVLEAVKDKVAHMSQTPCDFCNRDNDNCMECWLVK